MACGINLHVNVLHKVKEATESHHRKVSFWTIVDGLLAFISSVLYCNTMSLSIPQVPVNERSGLLEKLCVQHLCCPVQCTFICCIGSLQY